MPNGMIPTEESKRAELARLGFDPAKFDIDNETLSVIPRPPAPGIGATIASTAAMAIPETIASLAGASAGASYGSRFPSPWAPAIGGFAGAVSAPFLVGDENLAGWKNKMPQSWRETAARGAEANPIAGMIGQQLAGIIGLRPAPFILRDTARGLGKMLTGKAATAAEKLATAGTAFGAGVGAAIPIGEDIAQRKDVNWPRALVGAAGGSLLSEPNVIGRKLFRLPAAHAAPVAGEKPAAAPVRDVSVNAIQFQPEVETALKDLGYEFSSPAEMEQFLAPVRDLLQKSPKARKGQLTKLQTAIERAEQQAELLPLSQRMEKLAEIDALRKQTEAYPVADLIGNALSEARKRGSRIDYAPWETEGGMPGMGVDEGTGQLTAPDEIRARDFQQARAEEAQQNAQAQQYKLDNTQAEVLADALRLRQIEGSVEAPRPKVTEYTQQDAYGPDRTLPQAEPGMTDAELLQEKYDRDPQMALLPGMGKDYKYGPGESKLKERTPFNLFASETHKLEKGATPTHGAMSKAWLGAFNLRREMEGRYSSKHLRALEQLSHEQQQEFHDLMIKSRRSGQPMVSQDPAVQAVIDQTRQAFELSADEQIADNQPVFYYDNKGKLKSRTRGKDPTYYPMSIDEAVSRTLREGQGTQEFADRRQEFLDYLTQNGVSAAEAEARFNSLLGSFQRNSANANSLAFDAVRTPEGYGLPDTWIERDPMKNLRKYWSNFTKDRAFWNKIESSPELMTALGSKTFKGNQPIPSALAQGIPNLVNDPALQKIWESYIGKDAPANEPIIAGAGRVTNAMLLGGPVTKVTDMATTPLKGLAYTAPGHMDDVAKGLAAWKQGYENAFTQGWNKPGGLTVVHDVLGFGETAGNAMAHFAQAWTKVTGSEQLELLSRGMAQSIGEFIGDSWRTIAQTGDQRAIDFLSRLGDDWQTVSREELGTRIGMLMQGRYDITNLPGWMKNSPIAPFVTMMRWSVEQTNNFLRFAVRPALKDGNYRPLMMTLLGGLGGGVAINALREQISGKKAYTPSVEELEEGYGSPGWNDAVAYKMMAAAQVTGTMGILSEILKQGYEMATSRQPQGFQYPVASVGKDIIQRVTAAADAINKGERWDKVTTAMLDDIAKRHIQAYRIARNAAGRMGMAQAPQQEIAESNMRRDMDTWSRMMGRPVQSSLTAMPSYSRLEEREFDRANPQTAAGMIPGMIQKALTRANGDPMQMQSNLRQLKTIQTQGMPSPGRDPAGFMNYYNWVSRTQGPEAASRLMSDYIRRLNENKMKSDMIPSISLGQ